MPSALPARLRMIVMSVFSDMPETEPSALTKLTVPTRRDEVVEFSLGVSVN